MVTISDALRNVGVALSVDKRSRAGTGCTTTQATAFTPLRMPGPTSPCGRGATHVLFARRIPTSVTETSVGCSCHQSGFFGRPERTRRTRRPAAVQWNWRPIVWTCLAPIHRICVRAAVLIPRAVSSCTSPPARSVRWRTQSQVIEWTIARRAMARRNLSAGGWPIRRTDALRE